ncbi:MAG: glycosyltransferase [Bacteroidales bacterium]|nr:glycosyltransferase [Bacteroidales bacterium]
MVRILYIVDEAYPTTSANGRIVYRIIDELIKHSDIKITVLCRARNQEQLHVKSFNGCKVIHTPAINATKAEGLRKKLGKLKWLRYLVFPRTIYYRFSGERDYFMAEAKLWIKRHLNEFDVIVANSMPFYPLELAAKFGSRLPVLLYKMEPVAHYLDPNNFELGKKIENDWDNQARAIVMEDLTYKFYKQYASSDNLKKVTVAKYPCVIRPNEYPIINEMLKKDVCNLVYVGKFYYKKRDPEFLFSLMDAIQDKAVHLTIAGSYSYANLSKDYVDKYFTNRIPYISYIGEVSSQQADALLLAADILVNIGNKVPDQMPSKILNYISAGKPILNIYGIDDCPTLPYLEKYPLALNIKDGEEITNELIDKIYQFVQLSKGKNVPFSMIEKQFEECTPRYVGQQFYDIIKSITE